MAFETETNAWESIPKESDWYVEEALNEAKLMATGVPQGYAMGFRTFDHFFRLKNRQFVVIAGRPAMGKTSFALQIAYNMAMELLAQGDTQGRIVFYSAEMSGVELYHKIASQLTGINLQEGYAGRWSERDAEWFQETLESLRPLPLMVNDLNLIKTAHMLEGLEGMVASGLLPRAVFFDYIELGADDDKYKENERVAQIAYRLKHIASILNIPVIGLSQVNRAVEGEASKMPLMVNLAGSDSVPRTADKVLTLMRPGYYLRNGMSCACEYDADKEGVCYVSVQKDRFGRAGQTFRLALNERTYKFEDYPIAAGGLAIDRLVRDLRSKPASDYIL
jgi:replicative DNA helicase